jgi:hypothetical protein
MKRCICSGGTFSAGTSSSGRIECITFSNRSGAIPRSASEAYETVKRLDYDDGIVPTGARPG